ncbi:MAG: HAMP domain-containing sensor histidine kinase [Sulfurimonas sp.]|jgi:signal transduction histidine kinase
MKLKIDNFFTSGFVFDDSQLDLKSAYQMINIALLLSAAAFMYGIVVNTIKEIPNFVPLEALLLFMNVLMFFALRKYKSAFEKVTMIITVQCTFLLLAIIYTSAPEEMKHTWIYTYPIVLLYFQKKYYGIYWFIFLLFMIMIAPVQDFIEVKYSLFQVTYISVVLLVVSAIVRFYQIKMLEAKELILKQQNELLDFNAELERQVKEKTAALIELNESLEAKVEEKAVELFQKDKLITVQSKQAVMGEMINMIAHQWRQPLSMITLNIANYQFEQLLNKEQKARKIDKTLAQISDTILYLSETIDDFQTYFHPNKELSVIEVDALLQKAVNFILPRVSDGSIKITLQKSEGLFIHTYINEIVQVLLNLFNNAVDALKNSTQSEPKITIYTEDKENTLLIFVKDNANGISDENVVKIFEPYFSTKGKNGTGLGLYMSQMIVQKQFYGDISVETSPEGSTFRVEISKKLYENR